MAKSNHPIPKIPPTPTPAQIGALQRYASRVGRTWKQRLASDWMRATYPGATPDDSALLQQVRNAFGPAWLIRFRFPEATIPVDGGTLVIDDNENRRHRDAAKPLRAEFRVSAAHMFGYGATPADALCELADVMDAQIFALQRARAQVMAAATGLASTHGSPLPYTPTGPSVALEVTLETPPDEVER